MKTKEIIIEVKKSKNYQTYGCSEVITIEEIDDIKTVKKEAFDRCKRTVMAQIMMDGDSKQ